VLYLPSCRQSGVHFLHASQYYHRVGVREGGVNGADNEPIQRFGRGVAADDGDGVSAWGWLYQSSDPHVGRYGRRAIDGESSVREVVALVLAAARDSGCCRFPAAGSHGAFPVAWVLGCALKRVGGCGIGGTR